VLNKGDKTTLKIDWLEGGKLLVMQDGKQIGLKEPILAKTDPPKVEPPKVAPTADAGMFALEFDGVKSIVEAPSLNFAPDLPLTVEVVVTPARTDAIRTLLSLHGQESFSLFLRKDTWAFNRLFAKQTLVADGPSTVIANQRYHLAGVWDGKMVRVYVNGRKFEEKKRGTTGTFGPWGLLLGAMRHTDSKDAPALHFAGRVEALRVSQSARYDKDFEPAFRFSNDKDTLALYHFDEGKGETLKDSSGNKNHGKIVGAKWVNANGTPISPPPTVIDLLSLIDPSKDRIAGTWAFKDGGLHASDPKSNARLQVPYQPPEEYDLRVVYTRVRGKQGIIVALVGGGRPFGFVAAGLDGNNCVYAFDRVDYQPYRSNSTTVRLPDIKLGQAYELVLQVRKDGATAFLDGKKITSLKTDFSNVSGGPPDERKDIKAFGLRTSQQFGNMATFHAIEVTEISGPGTFTRPDDPAAKKAAERRAMTKAEFSSDPPTDKVWLESVAALKPQEQVKAVVDRLRELNPEFQGNVTPKFDADSVTELHFNTSKVANISPLKALKNLKRLTANVPDSDQGQLADLSPLKGLPLEALNIRGNRQIVDLSPLEGMPLTDLYLGHDVGAERPAALADHEAETLHLLLHRREQP
jgi:hypothetical protein